MATKGKPEAVAYLRTSSATNVGADKDSEKRQRAAILAHAKRAGVSVVDWFYDAGVPGTVPVLARPAFSAMLGRLDGNGVRMVLVEDASRFARQVLEQEQGIAEMIRRGVRVLTAGGDDLTETEDETRVMVRQILGAVAQNEKTRLVKKLKAARDRAAEARGFRTDKPRAVLAGDALALARKLHRKNPHTGERRSLRTISAALAEAGHVSPRTGEPFTAETIRLALARKDA